jgi:hypothetical protein
MSTASSRLARDPDLQFRCVHAVCSSATSRSSTRRDCTPPASILSFSSLALRMREQVALLRFEHLQILREDLALPFANACRQRLVVRVEVASHAPEVPDRGLGLRGDEVDHHGRHLVRLVGLVAAVAGMRDADLDQHVAGRREAADLPSVHRHVVGQVGAPRSAMRQKGGAMMLLMCG